MTDYTRITNNSETLIDYVITNNDYSLAQININNKIADHETIDIHIYT